MPFHLKSGRAFWTWHSPVKRSFVAGKEFCVSFEYQNGHEACEIQPHMHTATLKYAGEQLACSVFLPPME